MTDRAELLRQSQGRREANRKGWATRWLRYGPTGRNECAEFADPLYIEHLMHRWLNVHDIRAMGERAVRETA